MRVNLQLLGVYLALAAICIVLTIASPYFLTVQNITNILVQASTMALIAAGLTIVLIAGEIDLSFATMQAFVGSVSALLMVNIGFPWPLSAILALGAGLFAGLIAGAITALARLPSFITTLAMQGVLLGGAFLLTNGQPVAGFPDGYSLIARGKVGPIPIPIVVVVVVYVLLHLMLTRTKFGLQIYAVGGSRDAAVLIGISWQRVTVGVLALSALLASISGIVITSKLGAGSGNYGPADLLPAVAAVIIGGTSLLGGVGTLAGTLGGVLIIVTINNALVLLNVSQFWQQLVVGLIILTAVLIDKGARGYLGDVRVPAFWRRQRVRDEQSS